MPEHSDVKVPVYYRRTSVPSCKRQITFLLSCIFRRHRGLFVSHCSSAVPQEQLLCPLSPAISTHFRSRTVRGYGANHGPVNTHTHRRTHPKVYQSLDSCEFRCEWTNVLVQNSISVIGSLVGQTCRGALSSGTIRKEKKKEKKMCVNSRKTASAKVCDVSGSSSPRTHPLSWIQSTRSELKLQRVLAYMCCVQMSTICQPLVSLTDYFSFFFFVFEAFQTKLN